MIKLQVDSGLRTYRIPGGGVLRFNPADPALFLRLEQLQQQLQHLESTDPLQLDKDMKDMLSKALGAGNDVDAALGGVSLFARNRSGCTVLESLLGALMPVLQEGAEQCAENC